MFGVPLRNPLFTGRERELAAVEAALREGVAALHGLGGEGKTSTAVEYAHRHAGEYDRVLMVRAERSGEFETQMAGLAEALELPEAKLADEDAQFRAVVAWFERTPNWLLIVDNAEDPIALKLKLPRHPAGHVLVTTRETVLPRFGKSVEVRHLDDDTGALLLLRCAGRLGFEETLDSAPEEEVQDARKVSHELGGLALALDQAGTYMMRRSMAPGAYLDLYRQYRTKLFENGENPDHATVNVTFTMALEQVEAIPEHGPAAAQVIRLCSFLAPVSIPDEVFRSDPREIEPPLDECVVNDLAWQDVVEATTRFALMRRSVDSTGFVLHRLVAEVVRGGMSEDEQRSRTEATIAAVNAAFPVADYPNWPLCARLLPHSLSLRAARAELSTTSPLASCLLDKSATYLRQRGRYAEALAIHQEVLFIVRSLHGDDHYNVAAALNNLGLLLTLMGESTAAAEVLEEAVAIDERLPDVNDAGQATHLDNLAGVYYRHGRTDEAVACQWRALALTEGRLGPDHPEVSIRLSNLANGLADQGWFLEAEQMLQRSLAIMTAEFGERHPNTAMTLMNLGRLYMAYNLLEPAEAPLRQAQAMLDDIHCMEHTDCAAPRFWLARWHYLNGDLQSALDELQQTLAMEQRLLGPAHPDAVNSREWVAYIEQRIAVCEG